MTRNYRALGYNVVEMWGCEWHEEVANMSKMHASMAHELIAEELADRAEAQRAVYDGEDPLHEQGFVRRDIEDAMEVDGVDPLETIKASKPLPVRAAMLGGRTEAFKYFCRAREGERLRYLDFHRMYPSVMSGGHDYPVGPYEILEHPERLEDHHFGIVECDVVPPCNIELPVRGRSTRASVGGCCST